MTSDTTLVTVASLAALLAFVFMLYGTGIGFTGNVVDTGSVNISVDTSTAVNFTTDRVNFASGVVNLGATNATLNTAAGTVVGGTFSTATGFLLQNIGNTNVSLDVATTKTAATLLGGTLPLYQYNVSNVESGSCLNSTHNPLNATQVWGGLQIDSFLNVNTTSPGSRVCAVFPFKDTADQVRIDILLAVPSDSFTGQLNDTITVTATAV